MATPVFKRILLKLSGEALAANLGFGVEPSHIHGIAAELAEVQALDVQIAIVVGGGNFFRGVAEQAKDMDRVSADHMGMLATVINALAVQVRTPASKNQWRSIAPRAFRAELLLPSRTTPIRCG